MAANNYIDRVHEVLQKVLPYRDKNLISRPEWGSISFSEAQKEIQTILDLSNDLSQMPLEYLPDQAAEQIRNELNNILPTFAEVDTFSISQGDANSHRNNIVSHIHSRANEFYSHAAIWIPFLAYQKGDVSQNIAKLTSVIDEAQRKMDSGVAQIEEKQKAADDVLMKAREAAANAGAAVFTEDFRLEADANRRNSYGWLAGTAGFGVAALAIATFAYFDDYTKYQTALSLWPKLACRFLIMSLCFTASMWCGRIYKATRHLSIVNKHRALGLKTFQAFSAAASDVHAKDAVLLETTHSIFGNVSTGLISDATSQDVEPNIIQIAGKVLEQTSAK